MKKKQKKIKTPKRSILFLGSLILGTVILFLAIFIPIQYTEKYNKNKIIPLESETENATDLKKGNLSLLKDFEFRLSCTEYQDLEMKNGQNQGYATFQFYIYSNEQTFDYRIQNAKVYLSLAADWIHFEKKSSLYTTTIYSTEQEARTSRKQVTLRNLPDLPVSGGLPFVTVGSLNLYLYISYVKVIHGENKTENYLIKVPYKTYIVGARGGIEK